MFWAILLTFIITALIAIVLFLRKRDIEKNHEIQSLRTENYRMHQKLDDRREFETKRRVNDAYKHGLYDGRETDRAYRELLKRYKDGKYDERVYSEFQKEGA